MKVLTHCIALSAPWVRIYSRFLLGGVFIIRVFMGSLFQVGKKHIRDWCSLMEIACCVTAIKWSQSRIRVTGINRTGDGFT